MIEHYVRMQNFREAYELVQVNNIFYTYLFRKCSVHFYSSVVFQRAGTERQNLRAKMFVFSGN